MNKQQEQKIEAFPKVTKESIYERILKVDYTVLTGTTVTICSITMCNGFSFRGESACVDSPRNVVSDEQQAKLAYKDAFRKIWAFEEYLLAERLFNIPQPFEHKDSPTTSVLKELVSKLNDLSISSSLNANVLPEWANSQVLNLPLPTDHWLTQVGYEETPAPFLMGTNNPKHQEWVDKIWAAGKYAVRGVTLNGESMDFDPDALVQNFVVGMIGYRTPDGTRYLT